MLARMAVSVYTLSTRRRVTGWVAILAILLNAFVPALAHAAMAQRDALWGDFCRTAPLARTAYFAPQQDLPGTPHVFAFDHCPYCIPHGAAHAAPPPAVIQYAVPAARILAAADAGPVAPHQPAWPGARPRAPPAS